MAERPAAAAAAATAVASLVHLATRLLARTAPTAAATPGAGAPTLAEARRVLVVRLDEVGDVVLTTAFLRELRRGAPDAWIALAVNAGAAPLVVDCPYVDEVVPVSVESRRWRRALVQPWRAWCVARRWRGAAPFDLALLPRWGADGAFATYLAYFTGARARVGFSESVDPHKQRVNRGFDALLTHAVRPAGARAVQHDVDHTFDLLRYVGARPADAALELWESAADAAAACVFLAELAEPPGAAGRPLVALCPSGGHSVLKRWPPVRFGEVARRLVADEGARVVLVGAPVDAPLVEAVRAACPEAHSLVGRTTLGQLAALLRRCDLFVGNDAGPLHVAAAVGTPVVGVFGSSDFTRFGPRGASARVVAHPPPCAPMYQPSRPDRCVRCVHDHPICLDAVGVDEVVAACRAALGVTAEVAR